jgi:hypothetical protein
LECLGLNEKDVNVPESEVLEIKKKSKILSEIIILAQIIKAFI